MYIYKLNGPSMLVEFTTGEMLVELQVPNTPPPPTDSFTCFIYQIQFFLRKTQIR